MTNDHSCKIYMLLAWQGKTSIKTEFLLESLTVFNNSQVS